MVVEHEIKVRVRYADTDTMRVVYYANFFIWFESGRIELLRSRGIVYKDIEEMGIFIPVVEAKANYKAPARFDDELLVRTKLKEMGNTSLTFGNEVFRLPGMEAALHRSHRPRRGGAGWEADADTRGAPG